MKAEFEIVLSFVVPVYNVEMYLDECVKSIVTYRGANIEVILVDDGSTDTSGKICDELASRDKRIHVIHKSNGGLASARNAGLKVVQGKYVAFVDSDDYITNRSMEKIISWCDSNDADICFMNATKFYPSGLEESLGDCILKHGVYDKSKEEVLRYLSQRPKYPGSACTKLYKYEFLRENGLEFPGDNRLSEDLGFVRDCILCADVFDALEVPYYLYRQNREGSITNTTSQKSIEGLILFIDESIKLLSYNKKHNNKLCKYAMGFVAYEYTILLYYSSKMIPNRELEKYLKQRKWVLRYGREIKLRIIYVIALIFGTKITSKLIGLVKG